MKPGDADGRDQAERDHLSLSETLYAITMRTVFQPGCLTSKLTRFANAVAGMMDIIENDSEGRAESFAQPRAWEIHSDLWYAPIPERRTATARWGRAVPMIAALSTLARALAVAAAMSLTTAGAAYPMGGHGGGFHGGGGGFHGGGFHGGGFHGGGFHGGGFHGGGFHGGGFRGGRGWE